MSLSAPPPILVPSGGDIDAPAVRSTHRVMQILEYLATIGRPCNFSEISDVLGFPRSTTSMLLRSLVQLGYLDHDLRTRLYQPSLRIALMACAMPRQVSRAQTIQRLAEDLYGEFGETVLFGARHGHAVRYLFVRQGGEGATPVYFRPGATRPLCACAAGRMLLTLDTEAQVVSVVHRANSERRETDDFVDRRELLRELARCRTDGFSITSRMGNGVGLIQVAVLLPSSYARDEAMTVGIACDEASFAVKRSAILQRLAMFANS